MPTLVALDEFNAALRAMAIHAEIGLQGLSHQTAALQIVLSLCRKIDEPVADAVTYTIDQIADILCSTVASP